MIQQRGIRLDAEILSACEQFTDAVALESDDGSVSFGELSRRSAEVARDLVAAGLAAGDPVLVAVDNRWTDLVAQLGVWRAAGVAVPVHRSSPPSVVSDTAERTGSRTLVSPRRALPTTWPTRVADRSEWVSDLDVRSSRPPELDAGQALVAFTSGSTGRAKGVVLSHAAFGSKLEAIAGVLPFSDGDVTLQVLQLNFTFGQWTTLLTLLRGGTVRLVRRFSARDVLTELLTRRVDRIAVVPTMLRLMLAALDDAEPGCDRSACARSFSPGLWIAGGEPLAAGLGKQVLEMFPRTRIADVFGLSETSTSDLILTPDMYLDGAGTVGRPSPRVEVRIVGEDGADRPAGDVGELWIRTPFLMTGYLGDPQSTAAAMSGEWFRTGDLARFSETGNVELVGRSKFLIVRGGHKISPLRVESVIAEHPACLGSCAVGVPDPLLGERIVVLVVPARADRDNDVLPDEIRLWARARMNRYEVPDRIVLVEGLPAGRTGKLDRLAAYDLLGKESVGSPE